MDQIDQITIQMNGCGKECCNLIIIEWTVKEIYNLLYNDSVGNNIEMYNCRIEMHHVGITGSRDWD